MRFRSHQCWFPKEAETPQDYEDASAHSEKLGRAVIADGVSTAIFSRTWARLLTRTSVTTPPNTGDSEEQMREDALRLAKQSKAWAAENRARGLP